VQFGVEVEEVHILETLLENKFRNIKENLKNCKMTQEKSFKLFRRNGKY
jgi:hypothetical protein